MASLELRTFCQDFEMKDFIAQGTFAKVFKCTERKTGECFAVKEFQTEEANFDREVINNEVEIWRTLQHRNIVSLYKRFYGNGHIWVVLELVNGKTLLDEIVNKIVFSEEETRGMMEQVRQVESLRSLLRLLSNLLHILGSKFCRCGHLAMTIKIRRTFFETKNQDLRFFLSLFGS